MIIRNQNMPLGAAQAQTLEFPVSPTAGRAIKRSRRPRMIPFSTIASYIGVFLLIISLVAVSYQAPKHETTVASANIAANSAANRAVTPTVAQTSVDSLVATSVGATIAATTDLPVAYNVANLSQSLVAESTLAQIDTNVISKPQIVQPSNDTRSMKSYTTVAGDTVQSIAQKFNLTPQTVKWANGLTSDTVEPGRNLTIPPMDGITYTVRAGDTVDSIASRYKADKQQLISFNDLELVGNPAEGTKIIIPNGDLPENERPGYVAPRASSRSSASLSGVSYGNYSGGYGTNSNLSASVANKYVFGNCTWYAYERRVQLGNPVGSFWGNASTWAINAAAAGFPVDGNPAPGAIMQNGGGYGHVAIVESVNPGVSITISEMNGYRFGGGYNRIGRGDISWSEAVSGMYRYIH